MEGEWNTYVDKNKEKYRKKRKLKNKQKKLFNKQEIGELDHMNGGKKKKKSLSNSEFTSKQQIYNISVGSNADNENSKSKKRTQRNNMRAKIRKQNKNKNNKKKNKNNNNNNNNNDDSEMYQKKLTVGIVKKSINEGLQSFPSDYDLQLKTIAACFEESVGHGKTYNPVKELSDVDNILDNIDTPFCFISDEVTELVVNKIKTYPQKNIYSFFWFIVAQLASTRTDETLENRENTNGNGLRILLQILCRYFGSKIFKNINSFSSNALPFTSKVEFSFQSKESENVKHQVFSPVEFKFFYWIFLQLLDDYPKYALLMYYKYLFPLTFCENIDSETKDFCSFFITYLFDNHEDDLQESPLKDNISVFVVEKLIHLCYIDKEPADEDTIDLYENIKSISIFSNSTTPRNYFSMILSYGASSDLNLMTDILEMSAQSLIEDDECFDIWIKLYPFYIAESNNLLLYIMENWKKISSQINSTKMLKATQEILSINEQIKAGTYKIKIPKGIQNLNIEEDDLAICNVTCMSLIKVINKNTPLKTLFSIIIVLLFAILLIYFNCIIGCRHKICDWVTNCN